jgi:ABC-2 type transport system permease protein
VRSGLDGRRIGAVVRRHFYVQKRSLHRWFDVLIWPAVDTVIWGSIGAFVDAQGGAARAGAAYMLSAILLMHVMYQANVAVSTGFLEETWSRNLLNLMVTPLREAEYLAGVALFGLGRLVLAIATVTLAAAGLYAFDVTEAGWGLVPIVGVLMVVGWVIALVVMGLVLRFGAGAEILAWGLLFVVIALSGAFYPLDALPDALRPVGEVLPSSHAFEAARTLLDGGPLRWERLGLALAGLVVLVPAALAFLLHMLRTFRRRGYIARYS